MELTLFMLLLFVSCLYSYLAYSKNVDQTENNLLISGMLWMACALNVFYLHYYIPNGSVSSYTAITDVGWYWQIELGVIFAVLGLSQWYQFAIDRREKKYFELHGEEP